MARITQKQIIENRELVVDYLINAPNLRKAEGALRKGRGRCCLGHMCDVLGIEAEKDEYGTWNYDGQDSWLPEKAMTALGMEHSDGSILGDDSSDFNGKYSLSSLNDETKWGPRKIGKMLAGMIKGGDGTPWKEVKVRK